MAQLIFSGAGYGNVFGAPGKSHARCSNGSSCTGKYLAPQVIDEMAVREKSPIPGHGVRILDGNHHPASHHRIKELRDVAAGPLLGHTLVVLEPICKIIVDCVPCEDGHTQERALVPELLEHVEKDIVWIADRNFDLARAVTEGWTAMSIVDDAYWTERYANLAPRELALKLKSIAAKVKQERFMKSKRGAKKPPTPRVRHTGATHVSTKRLLDESRKAGKAK